MKAYRIKNWNDNFEVAQSRKCSTMKWVAITNSFDGTGYAEVMADDRFELIFCAWILMVELASKMPVRGVLATKARPLTPKSMAIRTRTSKPESFELALKVLMEPEIDWIEKVEWRPTAS